ncbi:MAG: hypothetical protein KDJ87_01945 [Rhizobiaceae bacterium]|nr:hypothetical protein [Rhizobiaceae bacterium]
MKSRPDAGPIVLAPRRDADIRERTTTMNRFAISLLLPVFAAMPLHAADAGESVYTDLVLAACKTLVAPDPDEPGGDFMSARCPGLGDYAVIFKEGDLRQSLHYGYIKPSLVEHAFESFGQFNHMNPKIEWRVDAGGRPYAAIQRFFVGDAENQGQVLAISRVGQPDDAEGCLVGFVDALANKDANMLAREVADSVAPSFRCGEDSAEYHGARGPKAGDPMIFRGEDAR